VSTGFGRRKREIRKQNKVKMINITTAESVGIKTMIDVANQAKRDFQMAFAELVEKYNIPKDHRVDFEFEKHQILVSPPETPPPATGPKLVDTPTEEAK
jgi:hypothetical protein